MIRMAWLALFLFCAGALNATPEFAGSKKCAPCHRQKYESQIRTSMALAMQRVSQSQILSNHKVLTFHHGSYSYRIERQRDKSIYTVSGGSKSLSLPIAYVFGRGDAGQTYVLESGGRLYESRVSFYKALNGLDWTMGDAIAKPRNLQDAAGRLLSKQDIHDCFGCHASGAVEGTTIHLDRLTPGVTCEHCHGSAVAHVNGFRQGKPVKMKSLSSMSTEQMSTFCGQCHRTWAEIAARGRFGVTDVRFQPYRLVNSKCYDPNDPRIRCVACHDPHEEVSRNDKGYDAKCLACHGGGKPGALSCTVAKENCVSCHMPKIEIPGSHFRFADHEIRIVKPGERYPD